MPAGECRAPTRRGSREPPGAELAATRAPRSEFYRRGRDGHNADRWENRKIRSGNWLRAGTGRGKKTGKNVSKIGGVNRVRSGEIRAWLSNPTPSFRCCSANG